jgi:hypothetical protein
VVGKCVNLRARGVVEQRDRDAGARFHQAARADEDRPRRQVSLSWDCGNNTEQIRRAQTPRLPMSSSLVDALPTPYGRGIRHTNDEEGRCVDGKD